MKTMRSDLGKKKIADSECKRYPRGTGVKGRQGFALADEARFMVMIYDLVVPSWGYYSGDGI